MNKLDDLLNIDTSNNALKFLYKRILCEDYRGLQISQHNRYTQEEVKIMLQEFYNVANTDIMQIRTTDLSKRPNESSGEEKYSRYINAVHDRLNRVTQDSMRKNYFVDFHRMGFIERLKYNGDPVSKFGRDSTKYVRLTNLGLSFINNDNIFQQNIIYNDGLNNLFKGFLRDFMLIICEHKKYISEYDYMFFISFLGFKIDDEIIDVYKIINLLKEFDKLSKFQKEYAINIIKNYCNPINFNGNKKDKRDFGN
ncbi:restriction endonuclease subunit R [bacterium]|nr:restriction endonuclease subunit R [bacterium]